MDCYCIIPARIESSRLKRKLLLPGPSGTTPIICYPMKTAMNSRFFTKVFVATDSDEIINTVHKYDGLTIKTCSTHISGTDRVKEAADIIGAKEDDVIVNIQGDEVELRISDLEEIVCSHLPEYEQITTLAVPFRDFDQYLAPENVKVVFDDNYQAIYFGRGRVPHSLDIGEPPVLFKHIGVYMYTMSTLCRFCFIEPTPLEKIEHLEQLRAIESGIRISVIVLDPPDNDKHWPRSIDTENDYHDWLSRNL